MLKSTTHVKQNGHSLSFFPPKNWPSQSHRYVQKLFYLLFFFLKYDYWSLVLVISIKAIEILQEPVVLKNGQRRRSPRLSQILQYSQVPTHPTHILMSSSSAKIKGTICATTRPCGELWLIKE